jgi:protein tyrosine/serine phosphatase
MNSIFKGDVNTARGRALARVDSLFIDHAIFRVAFSNQATVIPGKLYRSNHPTPGRLRRLSRSLGLTTVINLRGATMTGSYYLARDAARKLGVAYLDLSLESRGAPQRDRILRLHEMYRAMPGPGLLHCKSGADRAGLAAGLCLLFEGRSAAEALRQLSWRFGHIKQARTGILDAFFLLYQREGEGRKSFFDWLDQDYDEAALRRNFHANGLASFINDWILVHE